MAMPFLVASVVGTRPEAIKMMPVVRALAHTPGIRQAVFLTGQHEHIDDGLTSTGASIVKLPPRPSDCGLGSLRRHFRSHLTGKMLVTRPDLVLVHGDTTSAVAGAVAARDLHLPVGHVEAGLRSFDFHHPWPEEGHRVIIDILSDLLFAPTTAAADNLAMDRRVRGKVHVTGNTGIDALFDVRSRTSINRTPRQPTIVLTCHRKENMGAPTQRICSAVRHIADTLPVRVVVPLHCNPDVRGPIVDRLGKHPSIDLIQPLHHEDMVRLMMRSWLIMTDSGGLQEEGAALGRPVLVLRETTERPEGLAADNLCLVGTDVERIIQRVGALHRDPRLYRRMSVPSLAFGDGRAAPRIASIVHEWLWSRQLETAAPRPLPAVPISAKDHVDGEGMVTRQLETV